MISNEQQAAQTLSTFDPAWMKDGQWLRGPQQTVNRFGQPFDFPHATVTGGTMQQGNEPIMGPGIGGASDNGGTPQLFCFQPILAIFSGTYYVGIYANSLLLEDMGDETLTDDPITISGLLSSINPTPSDLGWRATSTTDFGWLEIDISDATTSPFTFSGASVLSVGGGSSPGPAVENDGGTGTPPVVAQVKARRKLYEMTADVNGNPAFKNTWNTQVLTMDYGIRPSLDSGGGTDQQIFCAYPV